MRHYGLHTPNLMSGVPVPVILSKEGVLDVAVTTYEEGNAQAGERSFFEMLILNGKTGAVEWRWHGDDGLSAIGGSAWRDTSPKLVHAATGPAVCVSIYDRKLQKPVQDPKTGQGYLATPFQLVLLDPVRRQEVQRRDCTSSTPWRVPFWVQDLDGDGNDEVVLVENGTLYALRDGLKSWWSWKLPAQDWSLLRIKPARQGQPATVVVASGGSVYGLDGATGELRWRCDGVKTPAEILPTNDPQAPPRVMFEGPSNSPISTMIWRQALAVDPAGHYRLPEPQRRTDDGAAAADPRLARPLPWQVLATLPDNSIVEGVRGLALLFAVLILPFWLFRRALQRRSWGLALLPVPWLGLLCMWAYLTGGTNALFLGWLYLVQAVVLAGPPLLLIGLVVRSVFRRRWRNAALLVSCAMVATLIIAGVWLAIDAWRMDPGEYYSGRGWSAVLLAGVYVWGLGLFVGLCGWGLFRSGRWLVSRVVRRPRPA
jgi:hypothetical protein